MLQLVSPAKHKVEISAFELKITYGEHLALNLPELKCKGNVIGLIGHNGAGKSTLMKTILGLLPAKIGQLQVKSIEQGSEILLNPKDHMAFCPETGSVFSDISVKHYIQMWCRVKYQDANYYRRQGQHYMQIFEIEPLLNKLGRELSKGQKRRVQTMIGFLINPKLFLIDEPFDGLDVEKTQELIDVIKTEAAQRSFIVSSHRMDVVERLADVVLVLRHGELVALGNVRDVCQKLSEGNGSADSDYSLVDAMSYHLKSNLRPTKTPHSI